MNMFTVILVMLCNWNFRFYLRASKCSEGSAGSLPPIIFLNRHNIRPSSCTSCSQFRTPIMERPGPWSRACTGPTINITRWFHHQFSITTSAYSYMDVCVRTLGRIPRYIGRTSNNNKMLINNSLCCFAIRVVYTRSTVIWGIHSDYGNMGHKVYIWGFSCLVIPLMY